MNAGSVDTTPNTSVSPCCVVFVTSFAPPIFTTSPASNLVSDSYLSAKSEYCADVAVACNVAYELIVISPVLVPSSVVLINANSSLDSSKINPTLAWMPLSNIIPMSLPTVESAEEESKPPAPPTIDAV